MDLEKFFIDRTGQKGKQKTYNNGNATKTLPIYRMSLTAFTADNNKVNTGSLHTHTHARTHTHNTHNTHAHTHKTVLLGP